MLEIFRFYMPSRTSRPVFGSNTAAATAWMMSVFAVGALIGLLAVAASGQLFSVSTVVLGGASVGFFLLARTSLPEARRVYEIDKIVRQRRATDWVGAAHQNR